jgi:predicted TIM-barrel fold metal-dependent hydrolase
MPAGFMSTLKTFYYDLAGATNAGAVASLLQLVPPSQVLFGTDFPPGGAAADYVTAIRELKMFSESALRSIERDNAVRLLPRFAN